MKIITVSSFKGGTAKTSISLNIGAILAKDYNKKVLLIDFDAQANLTAGLGFDPDEHDSLAPVLQGTKKIKDVTLKTHIKNLFLIPADTWLERIEVSGDLASDRYSHERLNKVLKTQKYDYIIIDTPPSLCWLTESAFIASNFCLVAATPEFYSIKGMQRLSSFMEQISKRHPLKVAGVALGQPLQLNSLMNLHLPNSLEPYLDAHLQRDLFVSPHWVLLWDLPEVLQEVRPQPLLHHSHLVLEMCDLY